MRPFHLAGTVALALLLPTSSLAAPPLTAQAPTTTPVAAPNAASVPIALPGQIPILHVRIAAFITADDDGANQAAISKNDIKTWVDKANQSFAQVLSGIVFDYDPDADTTVIKSTQLNWFDDLPGGRQIPNAYFADAAFEGRLPVVFRSSGGGNGHGVLPSSYVGMPGNFWGTWVPTDIDPATGDFNWVQNHGQLAHDIGHYLGLAHTFPGTHDGDFDRPSKIVAFMAARTKKAADFDGDGNVAVGPSLWGGSSPVFEVKDTSPDIGASVLYRAKVSLCTAASGTAIGDAAATPPNAPNPPAAPRVTVGAKGALRVEGTAGGAPLDVTFTPDRTNVMSYFMCAPTMRFSGGQIAVMRQVLLTHPKRKHLFCANPDNGTHPEFGKVCLKRELPRPRVAIATLVKPIPPYRGVLPQSVRDTIAAPKPSPTRIPKVLPTF